MAAGFSVVGAARGVVGGESAVLVTVALSGGLPAGRVRAAIVRFASGSTSTAIPVDIQVARTRSVQIASAEQLHGAQLGGRLTVSYSVSNRGNALDTLRVRIAAPRGWQGGGDGPEVVLAAGESRRYTARLSVPSTGSTGAASVRLLALSHDDTLAHSDVNVEVHGNVPDVHAGPVLTTGAATVRGPYGTSTATYGLALSGELTDGVHISAHMTRAPMSSQVSAFSRAAYVRTPPDLLLTGSTWRLGLGLASVALPELAGSWVSGTGVSFDVVRPRWTISTFAARPDREVYLPGSPAGATGELAAVHAALVAGPLTLGATAAHLLDLRFGTRRLNALGGDVKLQLPLHVTLTAEGVERGYTGGHGLGWRTEMARSTGATSFDVRVGHSPGGSAAFGRSGDEVAANISQGIGRWMRVNGSYWRMRDSSAGFGALLMEGWSLQPYLQISQALTLSLVAHRLRNQSANPLFKAGAGESGVGGVVDTRFGPLYASGSIMTADLERGAVVPVTVRTSIGSTRRREFRGMLGASTMLGTVEASAEQDDNPAGMGLPPREMTFEGRLDRVHLIPNTEAVLFHAEARRVGLLGNSRSPLVLRAGAEVQLPLGFRMLVDAERNPYALVSPTGSGGWTTGVRLERALQLPRFPTGGASMVVFRDVNGNGRRDVGEPGVPGVVVRRGSESAATDEDGRLHFSSATSGPPEIDVRTLPIGLVAPPFSARGSKQTEIGLLALAAVDVHLALTDGAESRVAPNDLAKVEVSAVDSAGRAWLARSDEPGDARFEALPPGHYQLQVDASGATEPLRPAGELPSFDVVNGVPPAPLTVTLRARTLRVQAFTDGIAVVSAAPAAQHTQATVSAPPRPLAHPAAAAPIVSTPSGAHAMRWPTSGTAEPAGAYTVQVAAYDDRGGAEALADRLTRRGRDARVGGEIRPFRVFIGRYATWHAAAVALVELRRRRIEGFVTTENHL